jgi:pimeloyl-ACP methyl ester carboxylesterase
MKPLFPITLLLAFSSCSIAVDAFSQMVSVGSGRIVRHAAFPSKHVPARNVDVWLPDGYDGRRKYAVLYMHDGQMLFDSTTTWNRQEWGVDEVVGRLLREKRIRDCIVVGVWNSGERRHSEYFPQAAFESLTEKEKHDILAAGRANGQPVFTKNAIASDDYLRFLTRELKPFIDSAYSTRKGRRHTFVSGSSMGGLISLYAVCEYPDVFGGAACLSTHWPGIFSMEGNPVPAAFFRYMESRLPDPRSHRIYFDHGTATLDSLYPPLQAKADEVMARKGYGPKNWMTRSWPGQDHSERAWRSRLDVPVTFLLGYGK